MIIDRFNCIPYGGDYCPEQWDEDVWQEDLRIMKYYGVNTVTINVHNWVITQPEENVYDYTFFDKIVNMLTEAGIRIIMGTSTTAIPNWMGKKYPDMILTDINRLKHTTGTRENYCPNSPDYRREIQNIAGRLAEHYKNNKNIMLWHMANEVGQVCYCDHCAQAFREYLKKKFGTLDALNKAWTTSIWGHTFTSWEQIDPPTTRTEYILNCNGNPELNFHFRPSEAIEYMRFYSDSLRECYELESAAIRSYIPDAIVTNNFQFRTLDYRRVCAASDVIAFDSYPGKNESPSTSAMYYDICRGLHTPGKPFMLMEMTPNQASWEPVVSLKRPGEVTLTALKGIGHGADSSLFFQIRRSATGFEKFHGAMIDHVGHENTRIGLELKSLGDKLQLLEKHLHGTVVRAKVAVVMDFDNMFGVQIPCSIQKNMDYMKEVEYYYQYFNERNIPVDVVPANIDLSAYKLVVAPMLYMLDASFGTEIQRFVASGGIFACTYYSGIANMNDTLYPGGYPGILRDVCGIWVEETDALEEKEYNTVKTGIELGEKTFACGFMCDLIHLQGAKALGEYNEDFYAGMPCICENTFGEGKAIYIGSKPDRDGVNAILDYCCHIAHLEGILETPAGVEACLRESKDESLLFLLNHTYKEQIVSLPGFSGRHLFGPEIEDGKIILKPKESAVLIK